MLSNDVCVRCCLLYGEAIIRARLEKGSIFCVLFMALPL